MKIIKKFIRKKTTEDAMAQKALDLLLKILNFNININKIKNINNESEYL